MILDHALDGVEELVLIIGAGVAAGSEQKDAQQEAEHEQANPSGRSGQDFSWQLVSF